MILALKLNACAVFACQFIVAKEIFVIAFAADGNFIFDDSAFSAHAVFILEVIANVQFVTWIAVIAEAKDILANDVALIIIGAAGILVAFLAQFDVVAACTVGHAGGIVTVFGAICITLASAFCYNAVIVATGLIGRTLCVIVAFHRLRFRLRLTFTIFAGAVWTVFIGRTFLGWFGRGGFAFARDTL